MKKKKETHQIQDGDATVTTGAASAIFRTVWSTCWTVNCHVTNKFGLGQQWICQRYRPQIAHSSIKGPNIPSSIFKLPRSNVKSRKLVLEEKTDFASIGTIDSVSAPMSCSLSLKWHKPSIPMLFFWIQPIMYHLIYELSWNIILASGEWYTGFSSTWKF